MPTGPAREVVGGGPASPGPPMEQNSLIKILKSPRPRERVGKDALAAREPANYTIGLPRRGSAGTVTLKKDFKRGKRLGEKVGHNSARVAFPGQASGIYRTISQGAGQFPQPDMSFSHRQREDIPSIASGGATLQVSMHVNQNLWDQPTLLTSNSKCRAMRARSTRKLRI